MWEVDLGHLKGAREREARGHGPCVYYHGHDDGDAAQSWRDVRNTTEKRNGRLRALLRYDLLEFCFKVSIAATPAFRLCLPKQRLSISPSL